MNLNQKIIVTLLMLMTSVCFAASEARQSVTISKANCNKLANTAHAFVLVLNSGDHLNDSISQCAKDAKLQGATVSGLGQLVDPTFAYFSSDPNVKPALTKLSGVYELATVTGNISSNSGQYFTHLHGIIADEKFHGIAGHIQDAKVGLTAEITITPLSGTLKRKSDGKSGFSTLES